jgi:hypothetical protein
VNPIFGKENVTASPRKLKIVRYTKDEFVLFCDHTLTLPNQGAPHCIFGIVGKLSMRLCAKSFFHKFQTKG